MYTDNARISHRQLFRQILTGLLAIYFLVVPVLPDMTGPQGVLCLLTGGAVYGFFMYLFYPDPVFHPEPGALHGKNMGKA